MIRTRAPGRAARARCKNLRNCAARLQLNRAKKAAVPSIQPCQPHRRRGAITLFRAGRDTSLPERGPDAGTMDQVRPQVGSWHQTTRTLDWSTYPLKPHQVAASAPTPDRSTNPAERLSREWRDDLTTLGPLQKTQLDKTGRYGYRERVSGNAGFIETCVL